MLHHIVDLAPPARTMTAMGRGTGLPGLRQVRVAKLMRQVDLAKASGINRTTIALIEAQGKAADLDTIRKLADALGVEPAELMRPPGTG